MLKIFFFSIFIIFFPFKLSADKDKNNSLKADEIIGNKYNYNYDIQINNSLKKDGNVTLLEIILMTVIITLLLKVFSDRDSSEKKRIRENKKIEIKNREIERRFGVVSHFLKNPLQGIVTTSYEIMDSIEEKNLKDKMIENRLNIIITEVTTLSKKIDNYLYSLKSEFNLNDVIKTSIFFMEKNFKKNNINIEYEEKLGYDYYGNKGDLDMVITILLENAVTALSTLNSKKRIITMGLIKENSYYSIVVRDNGSGIPEDILNKIFKNIVTTKNGGNGGFGLYIAKSIIDDFKGRITAHNDNGAIFKITLPHKK
jgi:signal transduction histidine kinase